MNADASNAASPGLGVPNPGAASNVGAGSYRPANLKGLILIYVPTLALLFLVAIPAVHPHVPLSSLTRDMAAIAKVHPLTGVVSSVGILLWCAAASICLFSASLLRQQGAHREANFLWWSGLMTAGLLVDDFFMFHEYLAPIHFRLNEKLVLATYAFITAAYLLRHRRVILAGNYHLLAIALTLFAFSMMFDMANGSGWWHLAEDGSKLLGISSWLGFHARTAREWLAHTPPQRI